MVTVKIDPKVMKQLDATLQNYMKVTDEPLEKVLVDQGRLLCKDLAGQTERKGLPKKPTKHATDIARKVFNIYPSERIFDKIEQNISKAWGQEAAARFKSYVIGGDTNKMEKFLKSFAPDLRMEKWDKGEGHRRWKRNTRRRPTVILSGSRQANRGRIKRYIKKQIKNIGNAKAGWARAAEDLKGDVKNPTRGIPLWAKRKTHKARGWAKVHGKGNGTMVELANESRYGVNRKVLRDALGWRMNQIQKSTNKAVQAKTREITKAFNSGRKVGRII